MNNQLDGFDLPWGERLRRWRTDVCNWSQQELVDRIIQQAFKTNEEHGTQLTVRLLAKWERGSVKRPQHAYRRLLGQLGAPSPDEETRTTPRTESCGPALASPASNDESNDPDHGSNRSSLDQAGHVLAIRTAFDEVEDRRRALHKLLTDGGVSAVSLDDWELTVSRYAVAAKDREPALLLADVTADFDELQTELSRCRSSSALRRLTRVAAQLSGLTCLTLIKLDERSAFRRWARTARLAAAEISDPATNAWVLAQEAYGHFYSLDLNEAIAVAQHAQDISLRSVGGVLAAALEARAHAAHGDATMTHRALVRAERILAELSPEETLSLTAFGYTESQLRFHESNALTHLGDTRTAYAAQDRALALVAPADFTDSTLVQLDRAVCFLVDGNVNDAAECALDGMQTLTGGQRKGIITGRARELFAAIPGRARSLPAVRDLEELLMEPTG